MTRNIIPLNEHPSNLDKTARIVAEDRAGTWTIYSVKGGFVVTLPGSWGTDGIPGLRAIEGVFETEAEASQNTNPALTA
jgi:hypothetical protein